MAARNLALRQVHDVTEQPADRRAEDVHDVEARLTQRKDTRLTRAPIKQSDLNFA